MKKRILAIILALAMVISMVPAAMAVEPEFYDKNGDGTINYVSFGDSMTNGYGLAALTSLTVRKTTTLILPAMQPAPKWQLSLPV